MAKSIKKTQKSKPRPASLNMMSGDFATVDFNCCVNPLWNSRYVSIYIARGGLGDTDYIEPAEALFANSTELRNMAKWLNDAANWLEEKKS